VSRKQKAAGKAAPGLQAALKTVKEFRELVVGCYESEALEYGDGLRAMRAADEVTTALRKLAGAEEKRSG
jgi:hypothetical protein